MTHLRALVRHPVARRVVEAILTLLGVSILTFVLLRVVPGNQITAQYGTAAGELTPAQLHSLQAYYGLDKPPVVQYFDWLGGLLHGNLGVDATSRQSVAAMTGQALPNTIELAILSIIIALVLGIPGGLFAASRPGRLRDNSTQIVSLLALSVPSFLLATGVSSWLADEFNYDPNGRGYATLFADPGLNLQQMLLPALVLGISIAPPVLQTTRASVLAIRAEDYVRTARAKGVAGRRLQLRHILRNALIPVVTMSGLQFGFLLGGAIVAEEIFSIPGIGRQVLLGLGQKEYAVVQSTVLVIAALFVLVNLATDLIYRVVIDPEGEGPVTAATEMSNVPEVALDASRRRRPWLAAFRTPSGIIGLVLMCAVLTLAVMAWLGQTPFNQAQQDVALSLQGPNGTHWFGTDQFGRDVFSRVAGGLADSLRIAVVSVAVSAVVGIILGTLAGYYQGIVDRIVGVITNVLFAFPSLLLALALAATLQSSWVTVSIAIAVVYMPIFARVARGPVLTLRTADYVIAATALGRGRLSTLFEHIIPNMGGILVVQVTLSLSWAILTEAALSFLGFGAPPPAPSLGGMVYDAQSLTSVAPWMLLFPGIALVVAVVGLNLLGDSLRAALDPKAGGR